MLIWGVLVPVSSPLLESLLFFFLFIYLFNADLGRFSAG